MSFSACLSKIAMSFAILMLATCTISGLNDGLPLTLKIRLIELSESALAPKPYTVSVGNATNLPSLKSLPAKKVSSIFRFFVINFRPLSVLFSNKYLNNSA